MWTAEGLGPVSLSIIWSLPIVDTGVRWPHWTTGDRRFTPPLMWAIVLVVRDRDVNITCPLLFEFTSSTYQKQTLYHLQRNLQISCVFRIIRYDYKNNQNKNLDKPSLSFKDSSWLNVLLIKSPCSPTCCESHPICCTHSPHSFPFLFSLYSMWHHRLTISSYKVASKD